MCFDAVIEKGENLKEKIENKDDLYDHTTR